MKYESYITLPCTGALTNSIERLPHQSTKCFPLSRRQIGPSPSKVSGTRPRNTPPPLSVSPLEIQIRRMSLCCGALQGCTFRRVHLWVHLGEFYGFYYFTNLKSGGWGGYSPHKPQFGVRPCEVVIHFAQAQAPRNPWPTPHIAREGVS